MWELDHKEGWVLKNWCFQTVVLEKTLESSLDSKEIKPVNPKENQPWILLARLMLKVKLQYLGHQMGRADSLEKTLMLGKIQGRRRSGQQEYEMVGYDHWLNAQEFEQTGRWWRIGKPGVLQFMESQRVGHDLATEQQTTFIDKLFHEDWTDVQLTNFRLDCNLILHVPQY